MNQIYFTADLHFGHSNTITQPIINSVLHRSLRDDVYLDDKSFALLLDIQKTLSVFEPMYDDESRQIWLEIPRGTAEEWKCFNDIRYGYSNDEDDSLTSYQKALDEEFPYETEWFFLVTSTYREYTFLKISDRYHRYIIFTNRHSRNNAHPSDVSWFLEPLLQLVKDMVVTIVSDPNAYNRHIEEKLPYCQRLGRIKSKELNRIIPKRKLQVENRDYCIQVMKELIRREEIYKTYKTDWKNHQVPTPFDTMSIRTFCKYYRIADTLFWSKSEHIHSKQATIMEDDVKYYINHSLIHDLEKYNLDSETDFEHFAIDHYGELGLSRMNVRATNYYAGGKWIITFGFSYSAYANLGLKIAMALYESGAPFIFYEAENLLHILEETGMVRISPFTFHDYLGSGDDEGVIDLPFVEDCDKESELTRTQYNEIVRLAEWEPEVKVKLDHKIPLDDTVYDLIRGEANFPMTLSEIRHRIEKKYETYLSVNYEDGYKGYYYIMPMRWRDHSKKNESLSAKENKKYYPTFNEAMKALIIHLQALSPTSSTPNIE